MTILAEPPPIVTTAPCPAEPTPAASHHGHRSTTIHPVGPSRQYQPADAADISRDAGDLTTPRASAVYAVAEPANLRRTDAMIMTTRIKRMVEDVKYKAQQTRGRAKQRAGQATGNARLRREGRVEVGKSRLDQFAKKVRNAIRP
jgi:uncharacterized protein YjbJ (UPF0337 family)